MCKCKQEKGSAVLYWNGGNIFGDFFSEMYQRENTPKPSFDLSEIKDEEECEIRIAVILGRGGKDPWQLEQVFLIDYVGLLACKLGRKIIQVLLPEHDPSIGWVEEVASKVSEVINSMNT